MSTPEGKVKEKVKALLRKYGAYYHMPVQNGLGAPALDFHVCHRGMYLGIETKTFGKKPTARQELTMKEIRQAGGLVFVCDGTNLNVLEFWLMEVSSGKHDSARAGAAHQGAVCQADAGCEGEPV